MQKLLTSDYIRERPYIKQAECSVFASIEEAVQAKKNAVALYDGFCKKTFSPLPPKADARAPSWIANAKWTAAIGERGMKTGRLAHCASSILVIFTRYDGLVLGEKQMPWGDQKTVRRKRRTPYTPRRREFITLGGGW